MSWNQQIAKENFTANTQSTIFRYFQTFKEIVAQLKKELQSEQIYDYLMSSKYIVEILEKAQNIYFTHQQATEILDIVLDYMAASKNKFIELRGGKLQITYKQHHYYKDKDLPSYLGQKWLKIRTQAFFSNKDYLKILNYFCSRTKNQTSNGDSKYYDLKFDFSMEQVRKIAAQVKELCKQDVRSFCFLSNYLYKCCQRLSQQNQSLQQIENKLLSTLKMLNSENKANKPIEADPILLGKHSSYSLPVNNSTLDIKAFPSNKKDAAIQNFIFQKVKEAQNNIQTFKSVVSDHCQQLGIHFVANVKLKSSSKTTAHTNKSYQRTKEKLFSSYLKSIGQKFPIYSIYTDQSTQTKNSLEDFVSNQVKHYELEMLNILNKVTTPITFSVSDMLRGKCLFSNIININDCCDRIKADIDKNQAQIVEVDNRLQSEKGTSDLVLKILIENTVAQFQIALDSGNLVAYQFSHKIYQLLRSPFFSPLTMLKRFNDEITTDFVLQMEAVIDANTNGSSMENYEETTTYEEVSINFYKFKKLFGIQTDSKQKHRNVIDCSQLKNQMNRFLQIKSMKIDSPPQGINLQKYFNNGKYLSSQERKIDSIRQLKVYLKQFEIYNWKLIAKIESKQQYNERQKQLLKMYAQVLCLCGKSHQNMGEYSQARSLLRKASIVYQQLKQNNLNYTQILAGKGRISYKKGQYSESIKFYSKALEIKEKIKGKGSIDSASTLANLGLVYYDQGNYNKAIEHYSKALEINERVKGIGCIESASIIGNIGLIYYDKGSYDIAIEYYNKALQIEQNVKGKGCIDSAATLGNIGLVYYDQGNYFKAIQYYNKAIEINQKIKGKGCIDSAPTLGNIGLVYYNQGNYEKSIEYYSNALQISERIKGKGCIDSVAMLGNIGLVYQKQGKYKESLEFYNRALLIEQKIKGRECIESVTTLSNIGAVYKKLGSYDRALQFYCKASQIIERVKGKGLIESALIFENMGLIYHNQGNYEMAIDYFCKSIEINQRVRGNGCIESASTLENLGLVFYDRGAYDASIECYAKAMAINQKWKGKECRQLGSLLGSMGLAYYEVGDYNKAIQNGLRAIQIYQNAKGKDCIDLVPILGNMGLGYKKQGNFDKAIESYQRSISICEQNGSKDQFYSNNCFNLGSLLISLRQLDKAVLFYSKSLDFFKRTNPVVYQQAVDQMQACKKHLRSHPN